MYTNMSTAMTNLLKERDSILGVIAELLRTREMLSLKLNVASKEVGVYQHRLLYTEERINEQSKIDIADRKLRNRGEVVSECRKILHANNKWISWVQCDQCGLSIEYGSKTPHGCGFSSD